MDAGTLELLTDDLEARLRRKIEVNSGFTDSGRQAHQLKLHFKKFDASGEGVISFDEFEAALAAMNFVGVQGQVRALFDRYDLDGSDTLEFREFASLIVGAKPNPHATAEVRSAMDRVRSGIAAAGGLDGIRALAGVFDRMDDDGNRVLDFDELRDGLRALGVDLPDHDFRTICRVFDINGDQLVTFDEFMRGVRGRVSTKRMALISSAFQQMGGTYTRPVPARELQRHYNVASHPEVQAGRASEEDASDSFMRAVGGDRGEFAAFEDFANYFRDLSAGYDSDDDFARMMQQAWGVDPGQ